MSNNFTLEETADGNNVVLSGAWSSNAADALKDGRADGLVLSYAKGFESGGSLEFITAELPVQRLYVLDRSIEDASPIANLGAKVRHISFELAPGVELDAKPLPRLRSVAGTWSAIEKAVRFGHGLELISTTKYDAADLLPLCAQTGLKLLQIKEAPHLSTLGGLRLLGNIETLRLLWAVRLSDISELQWVAETLTELRMQRCRCVRSLDDLKTLTNLRTLEFSDGPDVPSLAPLAGLSKLERLHLWGSTHPEDNDLSPLLNLQSLKDFRIKRRREYRPPAAKIPGAAT